MEPQSSSEVEITHRLLGIFTPDRAARRQAMILRNGRFVHYTSAEGALGIIRSKCMWMRSTTCMSDYREVHHGYDVLRQFLGDTNNFAALAGALDACFPQITQKVLERFDELWLSTLLHTYVASISEHADSEDAHGRLSMWRAFGRTTRVALVLNLPLLSGIGPILRISLNPVSYFTEVEFRADMFRSFENIRENRDFLCSLGYDALLDCAVHMLLHRVVSHKHEGFHEEREWRVIYSPQIMSSPLVQSSTETVDGIPQVIYKVPLDSSANPELAEIDLSRIIRHVIIGPTQFGQAMHQSFARELYSAGVSHPLQRVTVSNIPIRT
jgi:hypothetical protein